jgi:hypothetical protein
MKTDLNVLGKHFNIASEARRRRLVALFFGVFAALEVAAWFIGADGNGLGISVTMGPAIVRAILQAGHILFLTLPTAILLWNEPDLPGDDAVVIGNGVTQ